MKKDNKLLRYFSVLVIMAAVAFIYDWHLEPQRDIQIEEAPELARIVSSETDAAVDILMPAMPVIISDQVVQHILYGDARGGGHKHGAGRPCKSEFPADWDDEQILEVTRKIAANDNLLWRRENNGYYVAEDFRGHVEIRVVKGPQKQRVITAYPVNLPRNPCPANDN